MFKKFFYGYERLMWFVGKAGEEVGKPLRFVSEMALVLLVLDKFGVELSPLSWVLVYCVVLALAAFLGWLITRLGVVKYTTQLSNWENPELMDLLKKVDDLK